MTHFKYTFIFPEVKYHFNLLHSSSHQCQHVGWTHMVSDIPLNITTPAVSQLYIRTEPCALDGGI